MLRRDTMRIRGWTEALALLLCITLTFTASGIGCTPSANGEDEWQNWAIIQTQVQANTVLVSQGFNVTHTDYELISAERSDTDVTVRAKHTFDLSHGAGTTQFSGEGVYQWRGDAEAWTEAISLTLNTTDDIGTCTINYLRDYLERAGTFRIKTARSTSSTMEGLNGFTFTSSITSTPKSGNSHNVEFLQETTGPGGTVNAEGSKDETFISSDTVKGEAEMVVTINGTNPRQFSTGYTKTMDMDYRDHLLLEMNPLLEVNAEYDRYDVIIEQATYSLEEPAYFRVDQPEKGNYNLSWKLKVGDGTTTLLNTSGSGSVHETVANGKSIVTANLEDFVSGATYQLYVDPIPFLLIGGIIVGVATVVGAGAAVYSVLKPEPCSACGADGLMKADCTDCGATGSLNCPKCGGDGTISCATCEGLASVPCKRCDGYGKVQCPWCKGLGCPICEDSSWLYCPDCQGKGSVPCPTCGGSGDTQCNVCQGKGDLSCPGCSGKGWNLETCRHCGGDGMR
jgi:hypothetical protein